MEPSTGRCVSTHMNQNTSVPVTTAGTAHRGARLGLTGRPARYCHTYDRPHSPNGQADWQGTGREV